MANQAHYAVMELDVFFLFFKFGDYRKKCKIETTEGVYIATISDRNLVSLKMKIYTLFYLMISR